MLPDHGALLVKTFDQTGQVRQNCGIAIKNYQFPFKEVNFTR